MYEVFPYGVWILEFLLDWVRNRRQVDSGLLRNGLLDLLILMSLAQVSLPVAAAPPSFDCQAGGNF